MYNFAYRFTVNNKTYQEMKKLYSLIVALMATASVYAQFAHQEVGTVTVAPKAGISIATMTDSDKEAKMKVGFVIGADFTYQTSNKFALSGGLFYSQQGTHVKPRIGSTEVDLNNNYLNIPLLVNYYISPGFALKAGIQPGFLLTAKAKASENVSGMDVAVEQDVKDQYNSYDFSIPVGFSFEKANIIFDARYNFGLTQALKDQPGLPSGDTLNRVIMLTVGYKFSL